MVLPQTNGARGNRLLAALPDDAFDRLWPHIDRSGNDAFPLTQEFLAQMLGGNRTTVTLVARTLQNAGLIRYRRGTIAVIDRPGLEDVSCECYGIIRRHYERLLPHTYG